MVAVSLVAPVGVPLKVKRDALDKLAYPKLL